jgi:DNA-binding IclR family transcriptional regulator
VSEEASGSKSGLVRALTVLDLIARRAPEELGVSFIARELGMPKAVAHRILKDFVLAGYVSFDANSKQYTLGGRALGIGMAAVKTRDIASVAHPLMAELVQRTGETATLSAKHGWMRTYVDQIESPHEIRMSVVIGSRFGLHLGSSSKAIVAGLSADAFEEYLSRLGAELSDPAASPINLDTFRLDIKRTRRRGYAVSQGERQTGAGSVAAAIRTPSGDVWGSISLCGPRDRFDVDACEAYGEMVGECAARISAELGFEPET